LVGGNGKERVTPQRGESPVAKKKVEKTEKPYAVGDKVLAKLSGGRLVEGVVRAIVEKSDGQRLQVSFDQRTALLHLWQVERIGN
jgi:hypothetical protein